jgi:hypothetical protein
VRPKIQIILCVLQPTLYVSQKKSAMADFFITEIDLYVMIALLLASEVYKWYMNEPITSRHP